MTDRPAPEAKDANARAFLVDSLPCPNCGSYNIVGLPLVDENGEHQHARYFCTYWYPNERLSCGWEGWTVPGWDAEKGPPE